MHLNKASKLYKDFLWIPALCKFKKKTYKPTKINQKNFILIQIFFKKIIQQSPISQFKNFQKKNNSPTTPT